MEVKKGNPGHWGAIAQEKSKEVNHSFLFGGTSNRVALPPKTHRGRNEGAGHARRTFPHFPASVQTNLIPVRPVILKPVGRITVKMRKVQKMLGSRPPQQSKGLRRFHRAKRRKRGKSQNVMPPERSAGDARSEECSEVVDDRL